MTKTAVAEHVGKPLRDVAPSLRLVGLPMKDPHQNLEVVKSWRMSGDFPNYEASVTFAFAGEKKAEMVVHLVAEGFGERICGLWSLRAIEDRDSKGLEGFREFAESLGLKGAYLANIILGLRPS